MKTKIYLITVLLFTFSFLATGQAFEKKYTGQWGDTRWTFEFFKDGTYKRTSSGHFGSLVYTGKYKKDDNTIEILNGYQNSSGTINQYYLIDKNYSKYGSKDNGRLIDLTNRYEYYDNNLYNISLKNKPLFMVKIDSAGTTTTVYYLPIDPYSQKAILTLGFCIDFFDYPGNLKGAWLTEPDVKVKDKSNIHTDIYDKKQNLIQHYYIGNTAGETSYSMKLEYSTDKSEVTKITDSAGPYYILSYDEDKSITRIDYYSAEHTVISRLFVSEE